MPIESTFTEVFSESPQGIENTDCINQLEYFIDHISDIPIDNLAKIHGEMFFELRKRDKLDLIDDTKLKPMGFIAINEYNEQKNLRDSSKDSNYQEVGDWSIYCESLLENIPKIPTDKIVFAYKQTRRKVDESNETEKDGLKHPTGFIDLQKYSSDNKERHI